MSEAEHERHAALLDRLFREMWRRRASQAHAKSGPPEHCDFRWPILDPNEEDVRTEATHWCRGMPGHEGEHLCACGARPGDKW